jgi:hypothetical protein
VSPQQILAELSTDTGSVPTAALEAAYEQREQLAGPLLQALQGFVERTRDPAALYDYDADDRLSDIAMYLLAQFRDTRAFPLFEELCRLPEERSEYWLSDLVTQDFASFLASCCGGDPAPLQQLAQDSGLYFFARWAALDALLTLVAQGAWPRGDMIAWLVDLWPRWKGEGGSPDCTPLIAAASDLGASELLPQVRAAYAAGTADARYEHLSEIEQRCADSEKFGYEHIRRKFEYVENPALQMSWHAWFQPEPDEDLPDIEDELFEEPYVRPMPKIGRNDPCPCGSGKKYKKCCLAGPPAGAVDLAVLR